MHFQRHTSPPSSRFMLSYALLLLAATTILLNVCPQTLHCQDSEPSIGDKDYYNRMFSYPETPQHSYYANGMKIVNYPVRVGFVSALNINVHETRFNNLPFYSWNPRTSSATGAMRSPVGYALGILAEIPIVPQFALASRLMLASHSASIAVPAIGMLNVNLTTLGLETMGIYSFDEHWRGYIGCAFSGINEKTYSVPFTTAQNPERELPQAAFVIFSPLVGVGYDVPLGTRNPGEGRWILTPELIGMIGMNQVITGLRLDEYWLLSQIRMGISIKYETALDEVPRYSSPLVPAFPRD
jgi:hypothetical protein